MLDSAAVISINFIINVAILNYMPNDNPLHMLNAYAMCLPSPDRGSMQRDMLHSMFVYSFIHRLLVIFTWGKINKLTRLASFLGIIYRHDNIKFVQLLAKPTVKYKQPRLGRVVILCCNVMTFITQSLQVLDHRLRNDLQCVEWYAYYARPYCGFWITTCCFKIIL